MNISFKTTPVDVMNPKPGAYIGTPANDYHLANALNNSNLKKLLVSPAHYQLQRADSPNLMFGRLYHELTLTPDEFDDNWAVWDGIRRGKAWDAFNAANSDKDICTAKEHHDAQAIADAVHASAIGKEYFQGEGHNEVSLVWPEKIDGVNLLCKCRLDRFNGTDSADLKGTTAATKDEFAREASKYHYDMQAAFYMRGVEKVFGIKQEHTDFVFVAVEKATRIVSAYWLPEEGVAFGRQKVDHALRKFVECTRNESWPAPNGGRAEELTSFYPRPFEGMEVVNMDGLEVEEMEEAA